MSVEPPPQPKNSFRATVDIRGEDGVRTVRSLGPFTKYRNVHITITSNLRIDHEINNFDKKYCNLHK